MKESREDMELSSKIVCSSQCVPRRHWTGRAFALAVGAKGPQGWPFWLSGNSSVFSVGYDPKTRLNPTPFGASTR